MTTRTRLKIFALATCVGFLLPSAPKAQPAGAETLAQMQPAEQRLTLGLHVLARNVVNREPVGISNRFAVGDRRVYSFVNVHNPGPPTVIRFRWTHEGREHAVVENRVGTASTWRTWSSVIALPGSWRVAIESARGVSLSEQAFEVLP